MAKPDSRQASETLHEIESIFDRLAEWVSQNPVPVLLMIALVLLSAAGYGGFRAWRADRESQASAEIATLEAEYRTAMGAPRGSLEIPEPANAEAAAATRKEFATRFREAAERRNGTTASVTAWLEAGRLFDELGDTDSANAARRSAVAAAPSGSVLGALARTELGAGLERAGDPAGAAAEYLAAGEVGDFPTRILALADAARCYADAGDSARAVEIFDRLSADDVRKLPPHVAARLAELRARVHAGS